MEIQSAILGDLLDIRGNWERVCVQESLAVSSGDDLECSLGGFESFVASEAF